MLGRVQSTSRVELVRTGTDARLWSRRGTNLTTRFPLLAAAAVRQLPEGLVLDGELVVYMDGLPDFGALQSRETARRPASYMVFDLLAVGDVDIRSMPWDRRRQRLETLAQTWAAPLELCPVTFNLEEAREWFEVLGEIGVEGLVVKGRRTRYLPGHPSGWLKVRS
ncbi:hypothetical protein OG394_13065 [Kribbella sp. NBC_01245]|uniref:ATP-dependent DNA ligase n=1 Tax=Kribbella sp. NBC_01245 TaxID=2903578 RepID=UPI002E27E7B3|nr:hypothetical protein [Kribbella sp. NBC_01245]